MVNDNFPSKNFNGFVLLFFLIIHIKLYNAYDALYMS